MKKKKNEQKQKVSHWATIKTIKGPDFKILIFYSAADDGAVSAW